MRFDTVYRSYKATVRRCLLRYGVPERDLADTTHDVFLIVHRKLAGFRGECELGTWVVAICRRAAADYRRSARTRREVLDAEPLSEAVFDERPDADLHARERRHMLGDALLCLPPRQRDVVAAYALEDRPMDDVADRQCIPLQTAYARLYAGHRALRRLLEVAHAFELMSGY